MKIFVSCCVPAERGIFDEVVNHLRANGHNAYPKQLMGFFSSRGLHDPDELDEYLRDEDLTVVLLSEAYLKDKWLRGELHALLTLENKLRQNFVLPVFLEDLQDGDIPEECLVKTHIDFRGKPLGEGLSALLIQVNLYAANPRLAVFVSHNQKDSEIAAKLTDLMVRAFNLSADDVLCTSVDGHRLSMGVNTDETLRRMIREAKVFVCIATENSIGTQEKAGSFYVAAELGARWGMKRYLALVLAGNLKSIPLKAPFNSLNALNCNEHAQIHQFIREIAPVLGQDAQPADAIYRAIDDLVKTSLAKAQEQLP